MEIRVVVPRRTIPCPVSSSLVIIRQFAGEYLFLLYAVVLKERDLLVIQLKQSGHLLAVFHLSHLVPNYCRFTMPFLSPIRASRAMKCTRAWKRRRTGRF